MTPDTVNICILILTLATAICSIIASVGVIVIGYYTRESSASLHKGLAENTAITAKGERQAERAAAKADVAAHTAQETGKVIVTAVNGRMDELIALARKDAYAQGLIDGRNSQSQSLGTE
jgi:ATP-dependent protease ClpP protease subunit